MGDVPETARDESLSLLRFASPRKLGHVGLGHELVVHQVLADWQRARADAIDCALQRGARNPLGRLRDGSGHLARLPPVNAPARADDAPLTPEEIDAGETQMFAQLARSD